MTFVTLGKNEPSSNPNVDRGKEQRFARRSVSTLVRTLSTTKYTLESMEIMAR